MHSLMLASRILFMNSRETNRKKKNVLRLYSPENDREMMTSMITKDNEIALNLYMKKKRKTFYFSNIFRIEKKGVRVCFLSTMHYCTG